jgi:hypothetical protein
MKPFSPLESGFCWIASCAWRSSGETRRRSASRRGTQRGAFDLEFFREARLKNLFEMQRRLRNYRVYRKPDMAADWLLLEESAKC